MSRKSTIIHSNIFSGDTAIQLQLINQLPLCYSEICQFSVRLRGVTSAPGGIQFVLVIVVCRPKKIKKILVISMIHATLFMPMPKFISPRATPAIVALAPTIVPQPHASM